MFSQSLLHILSRTVLPWLYILAYDVYMADYYDILQLCFGRCQIIRSAAAACFHSKCSTIMCLGNLDSHLLWLCCHVLLMSFTLSLDSFLFKGVLCRTLQGHGHWVNHLALNTDYALRTGAFNPADRSSAWDGSGEVIDSVSTQLMHVWGSISIGQCFSNLITFCYDAFKNN